MRTVDGQPCHLKRNKRKSSLRGLRHRGRVNNPASRVLHDVAPLRVQTPPYAAPSLARAVFAHRISGDIHRIHDQYPQTIRALLVHLRRTIERTFHRVTVASATLTISFPPFVKLEIKTEQKKAEPAHRRRRQVA